MVGDTTRKVSDKTPRWTKIEVVVLFNTLLLLLARVTSISRTLTIQIF